MMCMQTSSGNLTYLFTKMCTQLNRFFFLEKLVTFSFLRRTRNEHTEIMLHACVRFTSSHQTSLLAGRYKWGTMAQTNASQKCLWGIIGQCRLCAVELVPDAPWCCILSALGRKQNFTSKLIKPSALSFNFSLRKTHIFPTHIKLRFSKQENSPGLLQSCVDKVFMPSSFRSTQGQKVTCKTRNVNVQPCLICTYKTQSVTELG